MKARLAESYEILNIMKFIKENSVRIPGLSESDSFQEYKATIMEYIMRGEANLIYFNNKIIGLSVQSSNEADSFYALANSLDNAMYDGAMSLLKEAV